MTIFLVVLYLLVIATLGYLGYRKTHGASDYLLAGRDIHPYVMALSYGATFISTSAIIGFGGAAGIFGMGILWLTFLNIFVGIFIAFIFFGKRTRLMGYHLDSHTFPEFLSRRFQSPFIQKFAGIIIFLFIPLYESVVLIGGIFILLMTGVAFVSGSLSNVFFSKNVNNIEFCKITGSIAETCPGSKVVEVTKDNIRTLRKNHSGISVGDSIDIHKDVPHKITTDGSIAIVAAGGKVANIIPQYIKQSMPKWFAVLFMLTLLAAAMSTRVPSIPFAHCHRVILYTETF